MAKKLFINGKLAIINGKKHGLFNGAVWDNRHIYKRYLGYTINSVAIEYSYTWRSYRQTIISDRDFYQVALIQDLSRTSESRMPSNYENIYWNTTDKKWYFDFSGLTIFGKDFHDSESGYYALGNLNPNSKCMTYKDTMDDVIPYTSLTTEQKKKLTSYGFPSWHDSNTGETPVKSKMFQITNGVKGAYIDTVELQEEIPDGINEANGYYYEKEN